MDELHTPDLGASEWFQFRVARLLSVPSLKALSKQSNEETSVSSEDSSKLLFLPFRYHHLVAEAPPSFCHYYYFSFDLNLKCIFYTSLK